MSVTNIRHSIEQWQRLDLTWFICWLSRPADPDLIQRGLISRWTQIIAMTGSTVALTFSRVLLHCVLTNVAHMIWKSGLQTCDPLSYLSPLWWLPWMAAPGWPSSPICPRQGGTSPWRRAGSAADSCPQAPSPGPPAPQPRPPPAPWEVPAAGSTSGSLHPGPQRCPGACQSRCSLPAHRAGLRGRRGCSRHGAATWGGTSPSTGTWQDSPPSPAQACLQGREEGMHHHTPHRGGGGEGAGGGSG